MTGTGSPFTEYQDQPRNLVAQHLELKDEPLHLAIAFDPGRDPGDLFLFELVGDFGGGRVTPDRELFEFAFDTTRGFPLEANQRLHLILTNPNELSEALGERWASVEEIREAVRRGDFAILYRDELGQQYLEALNA